MDRKRFENGVFDASSENTVFKSVSVQRGLQTADRGKMQTKGNMRAADILNIVLFPISIANRKQGYPG